MKRALLIALALLGCVPDAPAAVPDVRPTDVEADPAPIRPSRMTLSIREVAQPGWSGRLVVASFTSGHGRRARVLPSERPRPLSEIVAVASPPEPFAAIDGGFYDTEGAPMGLVRSAGRDHHAVGERGGSGIFFWRDGRPHIVHRDAYEPGEDITDALQSVDRLVDSGRSLVSAAASNRRAARSAVAIDARGDLHLVVAFDERAVASQSEALIQMGGDSTRTGPTIAQMAELLVRSPEDGGVGAREALGLDGGLSTSMVVKSDARALTILPYNATINALLVTLGEASDSNSTERSE